MQPPSRRRLFFFATALTSTTFGIVLSCSVPELDDRGKRCTGTCPSGLPCVNGFCGGEGTSQVDGRVDDDGNVIDGPGGASDTSSGGPSDADSEADAKRLRVFVTQGAFPPTNVLNACATAAASASLNATFVPWLYRSDGGAPTLSGPYYLLGDDNVFVTNDPTKGLSHAIDRTEKDGGIDAESKEVWTGIYVDGTVFLGNCDDWTSGNGTISGGQGDWRKSDGGWTASYGVACTNALPGHVYCFEKP